MRRWLTVDRNRPEVLAERILVAFQAQCGDVWIVIGSGRDSGGLFALWLNVAFVVILVQAYREQTRNLAQTFVSTQNANVQITNRIARQDLNLLQRHIGQPTGLLQVVEWFHRHSPAGCSKCTTTLLCRVWTTKTIGTVPTRYT